MFGRLVARRRVELAFLPAINERVFKLDKRVIKCRVMWVDESSHILVANSDGRIVGDYQPMTGVMASCTAGRAGVAQRLLAPTKLSPEPRALSARIAASA